MSDTVTALGSTLRRLLRDRSAVALTEFAFAMPILFGFGMYGVEVASLALANLKMSQVALSLADNASRVGESTPLAVKQLREVDINDIFQGARLQARGYDLPTRGRVTLSQLQRNATNGQWIKWQRCMGTRTGAGYQSSYGAEDEGATGTGATSDTFQGMGPATNRITAPVGAAVMFVELHYEYRPVMAAWLVPPRRLSYTASYIVRDNRDLTQVYNPNPAATAMSCANFAA